MKFKKILGLALVSTIALSVVGCSQDSQTEGETQGKTEIVIGATAVPHAQILEEIKPLIKEK